MLGWSAEEDFHDFERRLTSAQIATSMKETSVVVTRRATPASLLLAAGSSTSARACQALLDSFSHWCTGGHDLLTLRAKV